MPRDFDLRVAFRELRALARDPDDAEAGARLFYALGGRESDRARLRCVRSHPLGSSVLGSRESMGLLLDDAAFLASLPAESLGRRYLTWARSENLSAAGLEAAVAPSYLEVIDEDAAYLRARGRDRHDLFHVLTGYGRDPAGEVALLAFSAVQNDSRALELLSLLGCTKAVVRGRFDVLELRRDARRRARRAQFLLVQDWAALLPRPIDEVRGRLGLLPVPRYRAFQLPRAAA